MIFLATDPHCLPLATLGYDVPKYDKKKSDLLVRGLSGKLGNQYVLRTLRDGRTILCMKPDFSNRKLSKDQEAHHAKFKQAAACARDAARRQPIYAELAAGTMKNAYNVALGDWFNPPVIHHVDSQSFAFKPVTMCAWWSYTLQNPWSEKRNVEVQARDLAGNVTREEKMFL